MNSLLDSLRRMFCRHRELRFLRNLYEMPTPGASLWECSKCQKLLLHGWRHNSDLWGAKR
jgi:hypothetical protein